MSAPRSPGDGSESAPPSLPGIPDKGGEDKIGEDKIAEDVPLKPSSPHSSSSGKGQRPMCKRSLFIFPLNNCFRRMIIWFVRWKWFDRFILACIVVNSLMLGFEQRRAYEAEDKWQHDMNWVFEKVGNRILLATFTLESLLKTIAYGLIVDQGTYLRDPWNILDFVVVVSGLFEELMAAIGSSGLNVSFLRLFRLFRPLRSLNSIPEMKILVSTVFKSVVISANVLVLAFFLFMLFSIVGIQLMSGIFYHQCYETKYPNLVLLDPNGSQQCWEWKVTGDERLCGGNYMCNPTGDPPSFCGGHEDDVDFGPFREGSGLTKGDYPWCPVPEGEPSNEPFKPNPETDFVHFDHIGAAFLLIFQVMTLEGWTDLMYYVEDSSFSTVFAIIFFILVVLMNNFFMLNVFLAVVDEVQDGERQDEQGPDEEPTGVLSEVVEQILTAKAEELLPVGDMDLEGDGPTMHPCCDNALVRVCQNIAESQLFQNFVLLIIAGNVINMCLQFYSLSDPFGYSKLHMIIFFLESTFLGIFIIEMIIMLIAYGIKGYFTNAVTAFDGFVVVISTTEWVIMMVDGGGGGFLSVLRTFRLFRVLNKLANRWTQLKILLLAMVKTGKALNYWLVLFMLVMYICTLMWMQTFATQMHFVDADDLGEIEKRDIAEGDRWCAGWNNGPYALDDGKHVAHPKWTYRQDCIPRAHFDTFPWAFIAIFQIMTGENWNTIMYAGMRAAEKWEGSLLPGPVWAALLFVLIIWFGQILFLSLFLSMLISTFEEVQSAVKEKEKLKLEASQRKKSKKSGSGDANSPKRNSIKGVQDGIMSLGAAVARVSATQSKPLPGQISDSENLEEDAPSRVNSSSIFSGSFEESKNLFVVPEIPMWPHKGYACYWLSESNPIRKAARYILTKKIRFGKKGHEKGDGEEGADQATHTFKHGGYVGFKLFDHGDHGMVEEVTKYGQADEHGVKVGDRVLKVGNTAYSRDAFQSIVEGRSNYTITFQVGVDEASTFDNFILVCILVSTICMMIDTPVSPPQATLTRAVRTLDLVFAIIFIIEMTVKLFALGVFCGKNAYVKSPWNCLDGIVVMVSIIDIISKVATGSGGPGFLRVLRILRTFRPLRVISRNKGLKVVVDTLFQSLSDLVGLVIVFLLVMMIFALIFMILLQGKLFTCSPGEDIPVGYHRNLGPDWTTPLCLSSKAFPDRWSAPNGSFDPQWTDSEKGTGAWKWDGECTDGLHWQRPSSDTPICLARCEVSDNAKVTELCRQRYTLPEQLPHNCGDNADRSGLWFAAQEQIGIDYTADMQRTLVVPCGGYEVVNGGVKLTAEEFSCRKNFCEEVTSADDSCKRECIGDTSNPWHNILFCKDTCKSDSNSAACEVCRHECEAACMCEKHCTPLILDAALCHEQKGEWGQAVSQNFDNFWNAMLTLFEISTTEGWVDVMYAAADMTGDFQQPERDVYLFPLIFFLFPIWIFVSFMFLINLAVGIIVETFMQLKEKGATGLMLTENQQKWLKSRNDLSARQYFYDLENLDMLSNERLKLYEFVTSPAFETFIMVCIIANTVVLGAKIYPDPFGGTWGDILTIIGYFFAFIFTVEAVLKLAALRCSYWRNNWNIFDFTCVSASLLGIFLKIALDIEIGPVTSVIRILRITRLLKFFKELNRLFMCLFISIPKLFNVTLVWSLFLILFSILGMSVFGAAKLNDTLNIHGNFQTFLRAFVTLFRASTGEAWNEIMHDLSKDETDWFRAGDWCTPISLFKTDAEDTFNILKAKCLIEDPDNNNVGRPNVCAGSWNPLPALYWCMYTLIITYMIVNLVVAVILEGYDEGKENEDADNIDLCIKEWKKKDTHHRYQIPLSDALEVMNNIIAELNVKRKADNKKVIKVPTLRGSTLGEVADNLDKLKFVFDEFDILPGNEVHFVDATTNVIKLIQLGSLDGKKRAERLQEINATVNKLSPKEKTQYNAKLQHGPALQNSMDVTQAHTFKPGQIGITCDDTGVVEDVRPNSQATAKCIFKGYQILKVGADKYSKDALVNAEKGDDDFEITFKVPRHMTPTGVGPTDMKSYLAATRLQREFKNLATWKKEKGGQVSKDLEVNDNGKSSSQDQDDNALRSAAKEDSPRQPATPAADPAG